MRRSEIRLIEFPGEIVDRKNTRDIDPQQTPEEIAEFEIELRAIEEVEHSAAEDYGIILG